MKRLIPLSSKKLICTAISIFSLILLVFLFIPFERTVVPPWRLQVIDEAGAPIKNKAVRQIWRHHSAESEYHQEDSITDQNGFVEFQRRTLDASYFQIAIGCIDVFRKFSIYGIFGPFSKILLLSDEHYKYAASYEKGGNLPEQIVVRRLKPINQD